MNLAVIRYSFKEGFLSIVRHPVAHIATVSTIALMLSVMSIFLIFSDNAKKLTREIGRQPPVMVWMEVESTEEEVAFVEESIKKSEDVMQYSVQSPEENFEIFKEDLGEDASVLEGFDANLLPYTFTIQLNEPDYAPNFKTEIEGLPGVKKVEYSQSVNDTLIGVRVAVNSVSMIVFVFLCGVSLFVISNMVRIAVLARSSEINIMKYVGASNTYTRFPFALGGLISGLVGSLVADLFVLSAYQSIYNKVMDPSSGIKFLSLIPTADLMWRVILLNLIFGLLISGAGSWISVRKHIKV